MDRLAYPHRSGNMPAMRNAPCSLLLAALAVTVVSRGQSASPTDATLADPASNRVATILALARMGGSDTNRFETNRLFVVTAAHDPDRGVRLAAATALAHTAPASLQTIRALLADASPKTRECAAEAMRLMARFDRDSSLRVVPELTRALDDPVWVVRRESASAIGRMYVPNMSLRERVATIVDNDPGPACPQQPEPVSTNAPGT